MHMEIKRGRCAGGGTENSFWHELLDNDGYCWRRTDNNYSLHNGYISIVATPMNRKVLGNHLGISQNIICFGRSGASLRKVDFSSVTNENFDKNSRSNKYPNHCLLVHNLHTTRQQQKRKKREIVFVGWKVRP